MRIVVGESEVHAITRRCCVVRDVQADFYENLYIFALKILSKVTRRNTAIFRNLSLILVSGEAIASATGGMAVRAGGYVA